MRLAEFFDEVGLPREVQSSPAVRAARDSVDDYVLANIHTGAPQTLKDEVAGRLLGWLLEVVQKDAEVQDRLDLVDKYAFNLDALGEEFANASIDDVTETINRLDVEMTRVFLMARVHGYFDEWRNPRALQQGESYCPVCRRRFVTEFGAISRNDNSTLLCNTCGDRQALEGLSLAIEGKGDPYTPEKVQVPLMAFANSNQVRRLAGNSHRFALGYGLDFRLDTVLDQTGLHLLKLEAYIPAQLHPSGWAVFATSVSLKIAGLTPDQPIDDIALSVRTRDWMSLEAPNVRYENPEDATHGLYLRPTDCVADEYSPDYADPNQPSTGAPAGLMSLKQIRRPSSWDLT